jgi:hypothetical protein
MRRAPWRYSLAIVVAVAGLGLSGCEQEPADLPTGHVTWLDGNGVMRLTLRAKPYGYRVVAGGGAGRWARIDRQPGEVRLAGPGRTPVQARRTPEGVQLTDDAGQMHAVVRDSPQGVAIFDRAAAPLGRLIVEGRKVTVYNAGGLPLGTIEATSEVLVQRRSDGAITGTVVGCNDPAAAAILLLEDLPLEQRLALLALRLE